MHDAPKEFRDHIDYITDLLNRVEDCAVKIPLSEAIETLVTNMSGPWRGATVAWMWGAVPDDLATLFDDAEGDD